MKTLGKLKLLTVSAFIVLGMSSCLKVSDPDFGVGLNIAYIQQRGTGEQATFMPMIQIQGNKPIKSATAKFEDLTYYFEPVENTGNYFMELTSFVNSPVDTVKNWSCSISATSVDETPESYSSQFTFATVETLGDFEVTAFQFTGFDGKITCKFNQVVNATNYYAMLMLEGSNMWIPVADISTSGTEAELTGICSLNLTKDTQYNIAIAAANKTFLKITNPVTITGGKDSSEESN